MNESLSNLFIMTTMLQDLFFLLFFITVFKNIDQLYSEKMKALPLSKQAQSPVTSLKSGFYSTPLIWLTEH